MRLQNEALDRLRMLMQARCVFDLNSLNSSVTLCLPEHRESKAFGGIVRVISLKDKSWTELDSSELDQDELDSNESPNEHPNGSDASEQPDEMHSPESNEAAGSSQTGVSSASTRTKKLTKIMTLRFASKYIAMLTGILMQQPPSVELSSMNHL